MKRHAKRAAWSKMTTRPRPLREIPDLWFLSIRGRLERNPRTTVGFVGDDGLQWACSRPFWSLEEPTPFIIEPPGFDGDLLKPGATWNEHGQLHSKVQQRMVVTSARLVKTDKAAGNAEYEIDAYCVDENFSPPVEKTQYVWSGKHQGIVTSELKTALRAPGDFVDRSLCVWAAVAGSIAPGLCR